MVNKDHEKKSIGLIVTMARRSSSCTEDLKVRGSNLKSDFAFLTTTWAIGPMMYC